MPETTPSFAQKYFSPRGRVGRCDFWRRVSIIGIVGGLLTGFVTFTMIAADILQYKDGIVSASGFASAFAFIVLALVFLVISYGIFCIAAQRAHDLGHPTFFGLLIYLPYIGTLFVLYLGLLAGVKGPNVYGEDPLEDPRNIPSRKKVILTFFTTIIFLAMLWMLNSGMQSLNLMGSYTKF